MKQIKVTGINNSGTVTDVNFWNGLKGKDSYIKLASNDASISDVSGIEEAYGGGAGMSQGTICFFSSFKFEDRN